MLSIFGAGIVTENVGPPDGGQGIIIFVHSLMPASAALDARLHHCAAIHHLLPLIKKPGC